METIEQRYDVGCEMGCHLILKCLAMRVVLARRTGLGLPTHLFLVGNSPSRASSGHNI